MPEARGPRPPAQVHRAVAHDGRQLAVKVQHEGLRETAHADIVTIELLVGALHYLLPDFDYSWLVETTKENLPLVGAAAQTCPPPPPLSARRLRYFPQRHLWCIRARPRMLGRRNTRPVCSGLCPGGSGDFGKSAARNIVGKYELKPLSCLVGPRSAAR